ncbi:MAG TPA: tRNA methyl transferase PRC-barrel domain-containing protein, partial [Terriglobales bacterium]|nr:tRNA methyl transferase PRC-barrel domain-containing protein [Terriglobales bacterium]
LWTAVDAAKDQSYFLFGVEPQALAHTLFPLGELNKAEVRAKARELGLAVADKPESQEICFAAPRQHAAFVAQHAGDRQPRPGKVVDLSGQVIADHDGVHHFTIGQRRGLGISAPDPLYVTAIDGRSGKVTVGPRQATFSGGLLARRANWLARCTPGTKLQMKIRSRFAPTAVVLDDAGEDHFAVRAEAPLSAVTPGQAAVLYDRQRVVGGGWIERAI